MMDQIWSENKYINASVNVLLFLMGINFLHYGQLILPIICFLLFIDNRLRFRVNKPVTFILLCLFAVSFYAFSDKDFYCVMGFTCPMAYYIGSNMKYKSENNVRKIIYLLAIAMGLHVVLNSIYEYLVHGPHGFFMSTTHFDFWTREKISNTATAINADLLIGCLYYLLFHEKNRKLKTGFLILAVLSMFYLSVIGRRTPIMMMGIVFVLSFFYESFILKNSSTTLKRNFVKAFICIVFFVALLIGFYALDLFGCQKILNELHIVRKFTQGFINDQRFKLYFGSFGLMPKYLFGGQHISSILGEQVHDFWIDIYDYAGIVTWMIIVIYSFIFLSDVIRFFRCEKISDEFKVFMAGVLACISIQMFLEPVMTGASLFLIISIIIHALFERLVSDE